MHTDAVTPGTRLAGRYRLVERAEHADGTDLWRAVDEILARPVAVRTLHLPGEQAGAAVAAARRAAAVADHRFARVLDAHEADGVAYVVGEWVEAVDLATLLRDDGPLPPVEAARLTAEVAEALAAAHAAGVFHQRLGPGLVRRTDSGQVKILGLGVAAVLEPRDLPAEVDPVEVDTRDAAALLYAGLTARWPGGPRDGLPPAPQEHGRLCSPRQVRANVPAGLDQLTLRALLPSPEDRSVPRTPTGLARLLQAALSELRAQTVELPAVPPAPARPGPPPPGDRAPRPRSPAPPRSPGWGGRAATAARVGVAGVLAVALALVGWQLFGALQAPGAGRPGPGGPSAAPTSPAATPTVLPVRSVQDFDPPPGDGQENPRDVGKAVDGDPATAWLTQQYYGRPDLGGLKKGVGLLLDLGSPQRVRQVDVTLVGQGTDLQLRTADSGGASADDFAVAATVTGAGTQAQLRPAQPVTARYLLLWLTRLPADGTFFRGGIAEVRVLG